MELHLKHKSDQLPMWISTSYLNLLPKYLNYIYKKLYSLLKHQAFQEMPFKIFYSCKTDLHFIDSEKLRNRLILGVTVLSLVWWTSSVTVLFQLLKKQLRIMAILGDSKTYNIHIQLRWPVVFNYNLHLGLRNVQGGLKFNEGV